MSSRRYQARALGELRHHILSPQGPQASSLKLVLLDILEYVDWKTLTTIVGVETIAADTDLSERCVRYSIQRLQRSGYLSARFVGHGRTWKLRELTVRWPELNAGHETPRPATNVAMPGNECRHDRQPLHPISSRNPFKKSLTEGAASPSPANAGSAAQEAFEEGVRERLRKEQRGRWRTDVPIPGGSAARSAPAPDASPQASGTCITAPSASALRNLVR